MANEREVTLPSGGVAWVVDVQSHADATILRRYHMRIARFMGPARDLDGIQTRDYRADLTSEQLDERDALLTELETLYVRTLARRWEGVKSADGEELSFPEDVGRMREDDLQALAGAVLTGRADPNAVASPSPSTLPPASSPKTRTSRTTSSTS